MTGIARGVDAFRSMRAEVERSILPLATSLDGRSFSFQARVEGLELRLGGYVVLEGEGPPAVGQVRSLALTQVDMGEVGLPVDGPGDVNVRTRLPIRVARGDGLILSPGTAPFHDRHARPARPEEIAQLTAAAGGARLAIGSLSHAPTVPASLDASGFDRHTFLCGQSGSGKSYSLGLVVEQLLLETDLRLVILDPNSDFARLGELREGADPALAERWRGLTGGIAVRSAASPGEARLRLRFGALDRAAQAALLRLDPIADREEYAELAALVAEQRPDSLTALASADRPEARRLGLRIGNLGVERWGVWAREQAGSVLDDLDDPAVRCLVVDIGSLPTHEEQALVAESVLRALWDRRLERRPVLAIVDEAHNVCPGAPADPLTALATEHAVRIAGEGRKFGIYLLVSSQRPQKVHENVISQCDNLILMRMNSAADGAFIGERLGFAPPGLVGLATEFRLGEALVAGKMAGHAGVVRFGARVAREGGGDVDSAWARR
jgi:DNA helicase HerA-like ATPase